MLASLTEVSGIIVGGTLICAGDLYDGGCGAWVYSGGIGVLRHTGCIFQKPSVSEANSSASIDYDLVLPVWQGIDDSACVAPFIWLVAKLILDLHSVANVEGLVGGFLYP